LVCFLEGIGPDDWWVSGCEGSTVRGVSEKHINTEFCDIEIIFSFLQMHSNGGTNTIFLVLNVLGNKRITGTRCKRTRNILQ